ncbi:MAG: lysostaphin resistance A-like protein [Ardenticatenaceae bacterium]
MFTHFITIKNSQRNFWLFVILFFVIWMLRTLLYGYFAPNLTNDWIRSLVSDLSKLLLWVLPVWGYLRYIERVDALAFLKLNRPNRTTLIACTLIILLGISWEIILRRFGLNRSEQTDLRYVISAVLSTSFLEEILFRGFILNQIRRFRSWPSAIMITSILFVLIHVPGWAIIQGLTFTAILRLAFDIFFVPTLILGWLVKRTDSLYPSILLHMINNWV